MSLLEEETREDNRSGISFFGEEEKKYEGMNLLKGGILAGYALIRH